MYMHKYIQEVCMKSRINRDEREISISELWWYVISKWKWIVIGMAVGAILFGAYGAYSAYKANEAARANVPKEYTMEDLTPEEQEEVEELVEDYEHYKAEEEKLEKNYLMNIDYNNVTQNLVTYYIDTDYSYNYLEVKENYAETLVALYKIYLNGDEVYSKIMELEIKELDEIDMVFLYSIANEGCVLKIGVTADEDWSDEISDVLTEAIEEYHSVATELVGEHKLVKLGEDKMITGSEIVRNGQNFKKSTVDTLLARIEEKKSRFNEKQIHVYQEEIEGLVLNEEGSEVSPQTIKEKSIINFKYIFIGVCGGTVVTIVWAILTYFSSKKIKSINEIIQVYNLEIIGKIIRDDVSKNRLSKKIYGIKTTANEDEQQSYVADIIANKCSKQGIKEITICSSIDTSTVTICDIVNKIHKKGIGCKFVNNIDYDRESLAETLNSSNVLIAEFLNVTTRNDLEAEIEICDNLSINILGMIVII